MTVPANLAARHAAEQRVLAAILAERRAFDAFAPGDPSEQPAEYATYTAAASEKAAAERDYIKAVDESLRVPDNLVEAGTYEVHDCPGGAYVITEPGPEASFPPVDLMDAAWQARDWDEVARLQDAEAERLHSYESGYRRNPGPFAEWASPAELDYHAVAAERAERGAYLAQER